MAGHSKGSGQKPQGIYIPGQQVPGPSNGRQGAGGNIIRPEHMQKELQSISAASKRLEQRLREVQGALETADSNLQSQIDSNDTDISNLQSNKANIGHQHLIEDVSDLQAQLDGKANTGHGHAIGDVTGLQNYINKYYYIPMARGPLLNPNTETPSSSKTIPQDGWSGLYPEDMSFPYWGTNNIVITANQWNGVNSFQVRDRGWYLFTISIAVRNCVLNGVYGYSLRIKKYTGSTWEPMVAIPFPPVDALFVMQHTGVHWFEDGGIAAIHNSPSGGPVEFATWTDMSTWSITRLQTFPVDE